MKTNHLSRFSLDQKFDQESNQKGAINLLVIPLVLVTLALFGIAAFAYSSYGQAQDYKNNVDQKVAAAVTVAEQKVSDQKDKVFAEKSKSPYVTYNGPAEYGSLKIQYPRTWSAYVDAPTGQTGRPINGYFFPGQVPSVTDQNNSFALRFNISAQAYDIVVKPFEAKVKSGAVTIQPYQSPNIPNTIGVRVDGAVAQNKQGSMIILPYRDKTLQMWTESKDYVSDFNNVILPNFSLIP
jgi:hypothetical protein